MAKVINYAGKLIDPLNLTKEDFQNCGMQSAVTLSRICRFWSQTQEFYSVAQHCLSMVELFDDIDLKKAAIAHEVYEALTGMDVPSPIKHSLAYKPYRQAEDEALLLFGEIYNIDMSKKSIITQIKEADNGLKIMEALALMPHNPELNWLEQGDPVGKLYKLGAPQEEIKKDYLLMWTKLFGKL